MEIDPPKPTSATQSDKDIQVDITNARPTKRAITYELSWRIKHDSCIMLAFNKANGCIRGIVENSVEGRNLFIKRVEHVWPNAELKKG